MYQTQSIIFILFLSVSMLSATASNEIDITIVYDNNPYDENLETKWGFSCLVEGLEKTILFDVGGDGSILLRNMEKLKKEPEQIDIVVLSHVHFDHTGGLAEFLEANSDVTVGMPKSFPRRFKFKVNSAGANLMEIRGHTPICKDAYSTGELGTSIEEQSLVIKTSKGLVIITGCAHLGIVNVVKEVKEKYESNVYLVLGGFHLCSSTSSQIKNIINGLKSAGVKKVAPCHCSGNVARELFEKAYGDNYISLGCGKKIKI